MLWLYHVCFLFVCLGAGAREPTDRSLRVGGHPTSEHPGRPLRIPSPWCETRRGPKKRTKRDERLRNRPPTPILNLFLPRAPPRAPGPATAAATATAAAQKMSNRGIEPRSGPDCVVRGGTTGISLFRQRGGRHGGGLMEGNSGGGRRIETPHSRSRFLSITLIWEPLCLKMARPCATTIPITRFLKKARLDCDHCCC